jgi:hypothetical protein
MAIESDRKVMVSTGIGGCEEFIKEHGLTLFLDSVKYGLITPCGNQAKAFVHVLKKLY